MFWKPLAFSNKLVLKGQSKKKKMKKQFNFLNFIFHDIHWQQDTVTLYTAKTLKSIERKCVDAAKNGVKSFRQLPFYRITPSQSPALMHFVSPIFNKLSCIFYDKNTPFISLPFVDGDYNICLHGWYNICVRILFLTCSVPTQR